MPATARTAKTQARTRRTSVASTSYAAVLRAGFPALQAPSRAAANAPSAVETPATRSSFHSPKRKHSRTPVTAGSQGAQRLNDRADIRIQRGPVPAQQEHEVRGVERRVVIGRKRFLYSFESATADRLCWIWKGRMTAAAASTANSAPCQSCFHCAFAPVLAVEQ